MARNKYPEETVKLIVDTALELFLKQGYEKTSIQDIINHLGGLSKGAIYHHFKSKEEIFEVVGKKIGEMNMAYYDKIMADTTKSGFDKLCSLLRAAISNPTNETIAAMKGKIVSDPKFLVNQISEIYTFVVPRYIEPIIRQGVEDGSIKTEYPKELAEVIITLLNIWINPLIVPASDEETERKLRFFKQLLDGFGLPIFDEDIIMETTKYCGRYFIASK